MPRMSNYLESGLINHIFRTSTFSKPGTLAIALCSGTVVDTDTGALLTKELGGGGTPGSPPGGYNRQVLNPSDSNWDFMDQVSDSGHTQNSSTITFGPATADWGTVTYIAITDNSGYGSGNVLMFGALATAKTVGNGDSLQISTGNLDIYFD